MKLHTANLIAVIALSFATSHSLRAQSPTPFDLVITNGHIIDGTGSPWYSGDVGIRDGKVAAIGNPATAPSMRLAKLSLPVLSTCSASPNFPSSLSRACLQKSIRASRPKLQAK